MTTRYLIFNPGCPTCNSMARAIETLANGKIQTLGLDSPEAKKLLDQAFPHGWIQQPYLATVKNMRVIVSTRYGIVVKLGLLLGPKKSCQAYQVANSLRVALSGKKKEAESPE